MHLDQGCRCINRGWRGQAEIEKKRHMFSSEQLISFANKQCWYAVAF